MNSTQSQYRQVQSTYTVPLPHHRQPSTSSSGSYPSPGDTTSHPSSGPPYGYHQRSNPSLGSAADVQREYDERHPTSNQYYHHGYEYPPSGNSGYGGPSRSAAYYQQPRHYTSAQFGAGSSSLGYSSMYVSFSLHDFLF